jgi:hypothetical protein
MPYQRCTYAQLTAQINLLSLMAATLQEQRGLDAETNAARTKIITRIKHEIDRLNNHRSKVKANGK